MKLKQILTKLFFKTNTNQSTERTEAIPKAQCKIELLEPRVMLSATQHSEVLVDGNFDSLDNFDNVSPEEIDDVVNEIIKGTSGNDDIDGTDANETIKGLKGNDHLHGQGGDDLVRGGKGSDVVEGNAGDDVVRGGRGNDYVFGGSGDDLLFGGKGNDLLNGGGGDELLKAHLTGGAGNDIVDGGKGYDVLQIDGNSYDYSVEITDNDGFVLSGNDGSSVKATNIEQVDFLFNSTSFTVDEIAHLGKGVDPVVVPVDPVEPVANQIIEGTSGDDDIDGTDANETIRGLAGNDHLHGQGGDDLVRGGKGSDVVEGNAGNDVVRGGAGNDYVFGGSGDDLLIGGVGHDLLNGGGGDELLEANLNGGSGNDIVDGGEGYDVLQLDGNSYDYSVEISDNDGFLLSGNDGSSVKATNIEQIDFLFDSTSFTADEIAYLGQIEAPVVPVEAPAEPVAPVVPVEAPVVPTVPVEAPVEPVVPAVPVEAPAEPVANQVIEGTSGNDVIDGTAGNETINGLDGDDQLQGLVGDDFVSGGDGNDIVEGNPGNDVVEGGAGDDFVFGGSGDDLVFGGEGNDILNGGAGIEETLDSNILGGSGNDIIDGGEGFDVLQLDGNSAQYSVEVTDGGFLLSGNGTDVDPTSINATNIEQIDFLFDGTSFTTEELLAKADAPVVPPVADAPIEPVVEVPPVVETPVVQPTYVVEVINGTNTDFFATPVWFGLHDGSFDLFDVGSSASNALEAIAEIGDTNPLIADFEAAPGTPGDINGLVVGGATGIPPISPGETGTGSFTPINPANYQFFSFASMVIPSNDTFIGNADAMEYQIFDDNGSFLGTNGVFEIQVTNIYDAGTEINDGSVNGGAAFVAGANELAGASENGVVTNATDLSEFRGVNTPNGLTINDTTLGAGESFATIRIIEVPAV